MEERIQAILKERFGRDLDNCTKSEIFEALMVITKQEMAGRKRNTGNKKLYYISAEFLIGKLLSNNLINLGTVSYTHLDVYKRQDLKLAREVIDFDDIVDDLFDEVKDEILQGMRKGITTDVQSLDYLMIAKYYERIGDHATNIAEWVVYSINGHHKGE